MTTAIDSVFLSFRIGFYGVINQDECQYIFFISQKFSIISLTTPITSPYNI